MSLQLSVNGSEYPRGEKLEPARNQEVLAQETRQIVAQITKAVLSVRTLVNAMETPVRIAPVSEGKLTSVADKVNLPVDYLGIEVLLNNIAARLDTRKFEFCPSLAPNLTAFDHVVSTQLAISPDYWSTWQLPIETLSDVNKIVDEVIKHSFKSYFKKVEVVSFDGVPLRAYAGGKKDAKAVVVVPVCGMPVELSERWLRSLADDYYVITWESRGLFGEIADFDALAYDVESQAKDLLAVMDHFGVGFAHVMGLCGGAVIALIASSVAPERVSTLSLWHGDYELGSNCPKTRHQQDLLMLMSMASESRKQAASLQKLFIKPSVLNNMRADVAHLILYPYATGELLFRYAKLNGSIMTANIKDRLGKVLQPTLVVTSEDDVTAHPEGSLRVADKLSHATLHVEPHGDHLSLFDAKPSITNLTKEFIEHGVVAQPNQQISLLPILTEAERHQFLVEWNDTDLDSENIYVAPCDSLELQLTKIWEQVLGIQPIGVRDNFFSLGGNSLLSVRLFAQIKKAFKKNLPLATLFASPTIEQQANILRSQETSSPWYSLVPIQPGGSRPPLFGIHHIYFKDLSRYLGPSQPVYSLHYGMGELSDRAVSLPNMEGLAAHYIEEMRSLQPEGPYFLMGLSFGGLVAYEMAQQLVAQGQQIGLLALFDTYIENSQKLLPLHQRLSNLLKLSRTEFLRRAKDNLTGKFRRFRYGTQYQPHIYVPEPVISILKDYTPKTYSGRVLLFKAMDHFSVSYSSDPPEIGWRKFVNGKLEIHEVSGTHIGILEEPHVQVVAEKLRDYLIVVTAQ